MKISPIISKRITLREYSLEDFQEIHEYASDLEVVRYMDWGPNTPEQTKTFINEQLVHQKEPQRKVFQLAITLKGLGTLIGGVNVTVEKDSFGLLGYCLNKRYWGRGYATEAALAIIKFAETKLGLKKFRGTCDVLNQGSQRVLEKCGLKQVRFMKKNKCIRGKWRSTLVYEG